MFCGGGNLSRVARRTNYVSREWLSKWKYIASTRLYLLCTIQSNNLFIYNITKECKNRKRFVRVLNHHPASIRHASPCADRVYHIP